jgi:hypothetical protein
VEREYRVRLRGTPSAAVLERLRRGVELEDGPANFDRIEVESTDGSHSWFRVCLHEGRNREVRRLFEHEGFEVSRLSRIRYGPVILPADLRGGAHIRLESAGIEASYCSIKDSDFRLLLREPADLIIAAGGDGAVAEIVKSMPDRGMPLAILPLGTANNIAHSFKITGAVSDLVASWDHSRWKPLDIGVVTGSWGERPFVEAVGLGVLPQLIESTKNDGEPTSNYPLVGHKGSIKFHARFKGVSAHGSMPELGVNAIYKAGKALAALEEFDFRSKVHPIMGKPTLNVGTIEGGVTVNAVADAAKIGVDIRTVPGMDHDEVLKRIRASIPEAELDVFSNLKPVWTAPEQEWIQRVFEICKPYVGEQPAARTAPYMTDAANLLKVYAGAPTVVLGPGEAAMAHQTDEYASQERTRQAVAIYESLIRDWCR